MLAAFSVDMWSLGMLAYEIFEGYTSANHLNRARSLSFCLTRMRIRLFTVPLLSECLWFLDGPYMRAEGQEQPCPSPSISQSISRIPQLPCVGDDDKGHQGTLNMDELCWAAMQASNV